jgi:arylsulfatase A-like enzyme
MKRAIGFILFVLFLSGSAQAADKPNILIIWGDDIGISNLSVNTRGMMGYRTPNIDRIAKEGMLFTDYYGDQSCTAGRSSFITGQSPFRTGLTKVGVPGSELGLQAKDPTIAELLKPAGYATGQFGKNHGMGPPSVRASSDAAKLGSSKRWEGDWIDRRVSMHPASARG